MRILMPKAITPGIIAAGTSIPAVDTSRSEVAWNNTATYAEGSRVNYDISIYEAVTDVAAGMAPDLNPDKWIRVGPTNRMAPFDEYIYTKAIAKGEITYVLTPTFITGLAIRGVDADNVSIVYRDADNNIIFEETWALWEQALGLYEYLFGDLQRTNRWTTQNLPLNAGGKLTLRLWKNDPNADCSIGWIGIGQWNVIYAPNSNISGAQYGIEVTPKSYSYFKQSDLDGTYIRIPGRTTKIVQGSVVFSATNAPKVEEMLRMIIDTPVAVDFSALPRYSHLSTMGFLSGSVSNDTFNLATLKFKIDGNV